MFGDNMVLQRGKPIAFWGWAKAGESVQVELAGRTVAATTGKAGRWQLAVAAPAPGGPYSVKISSAQQSVTLHEVLVGDVWLCGGQSNMELGLSRARNGAEEIKSADHPEIRWFKVQQHVAYAPSSSLQGSWKICTPQTAGENGGFSAVAYFFGRKLQEELHVPIGLIQDCWGGTPVESWMNPESLRQLKDFEVPLTEIQRLHKNGAPEYGSFLMHWLDEYDIGQSNRWQAADFDDSRWKPVQIPGGFSELGLAGVPGIGWFRKEFTLPDPLPAGQIVLHLGVVEKMDTAYLNGHWVGASSWVENPRTYQVGDGILQPGRNVIAVRVLKMKTPGGFLSQRDELCLTLEQAKIPLAGEWRGALSADCRPPHPLPLAFENYPTMPAILFEGMIQPLAPFSIRGAIWYQGEANYQRAHRYRTLLPIMIADWRKVFSQGDFPFYIVSLPKFMAHRDLPGDDAWAELREAQALTARSVKNSGLAVTVDTGEANNIHPAEKQIVGERLAFCALAKEYGKHIPFAGPGFVSAEKIPGALKLKFQNAEGGLVVKGDQLAEFSVAGKNRVWHWAEAKLAGDSVIVSSTDVPEPIAARYAWQANPSATLFNAAGLPAAPFRTDQWPEITETSPP